MSSKYIDTVSTMQVIGCVFNKPQLLDFTDKYAIVDEDFADPFHKTIFGAIYKIYELGASKITLESISDFLSTKPKSAAIYKPPPRRNISAVFVFPTKRRIFVVIYIKMVSLLFIIINL